MSTDAPKTIKKSTPPAVAKWPKLTEPDFGTPAFPKPEGEYSVKLVFDEVDPEFQKFRDELAPYIAAAERAGQAEFNKLAKPQRDKLGKMMLNQVFVPVYDEQENPTGQVEMKLTMKASGIVKKGPREGKKWQRSPDIYDARGVKLNKAKKLPAIWGGSILIASFNFAEGGYFIAGTGACGLKMQLDGIQILTLRQGGDRSAESHGFSKRDGFDAGSLVEEQEPSDDEFAGGEDDTQTPAPAGSSDF